LGYGFYHAGLFPDEVISLRREQIQAMCHALEKYDEHEGCCQAVIGAAR
jgi:hypothetical protein